MRTPTFAALTAVALTAISPTPLKAQATHATVVVHNRAPLGAHIVLGAQQIVSAIYARAGVRLVWVAPLSPDAPLTSSRPRLTILIVSEAAARAVRYPPDLLGFTPGSKLRNAWLAYILGHRISAVSRGYQTPPDIVLAAAIAHEIGHMLLPSQHSAEGLMRATFNQADFRKLAQGRFAFTPLEAAEIRARLAAHDDNLRIHAGRLDK